VLLSSSRKGRLQGLILRWEANGKAKRKKLYPETWSINFKNAQGLWGRAKKGHGIKSGMEAGKSINQ